MNKTQIDVVVNIGESELIEKYLIANKPVLLKGFMQNSKIFTKWTKEFLIENYGNILFTLNSSIGSKSQGQKQFLLKDYLGYIEKPDDFNYYMGGWQFENDKKELLLDIETPKAFQCITNDWDEKQQMKMRWLFIGPAYSYIPMHIDFYNTAAWHVVLSGQKTWYFFAPDQEKYLYNFEVDMNHIDYDKYPLIKEANCMYCVQEPGDVVFNPSGWIHQVVNTKPVISFSENYINKTNIEYVLKAVKHKKSEQERFIFETLIDYKQKNTL